MSNAAYRALCDLLASRGGALHIALSGGIDSLTLMAVAARVRSQPTTAMHAISAAVPPEATARCRALARQYGWQLQEINAQEFNSSDYVRNPVNRCYFCKNSLFIAIEACCDAASDTTIATGTNTDDLGDFRPGLKAAAEHQVWQPYVEAGIDKQTLRRIARQEGLAELSALPAAPCLSSRVETGIAIDTTDLKLIHRVEKLVTGLTQPGDIRCRIVARGVKVQVPADSAILTDQSLQREAAGAVDACCRDAGKSFIGFEPYAKGSAFLKHELIQHVRL